MAIYRPIASLKSWNDTTNWQYVTDITQSNAAWASTSNLPTLEDDVWMDGKTIYVPPSVPIYANRIFQQRQPDPRSSATTAPPIFGYAYTTGSSANLLSITSSGTYYISASVITAGGNGANSGYGYMLIGAGATISGVTVYLSASLDASDNYGSSYLIYVSNANSCSIYMKGNVYGGGGNVIQVNAGRAILSITGSVYGSVFSISGAPQTANSAIYATTNATNFTCSISGSTYVNAIQTTPTRSLIIVNGSVNASSFASSIICSSNINLTHSVQIFGNVNNDPVTGQQAISAPRIFITGSSISAIQLKQNPAGNTTLTDTGSSISYTYASQNDVVNGYKYDNNSKTGTGLVTGSFAQHVRSAVTFSLATKYNDGSGDVWTVRTVSGSCYIPHSSSVRIGVSYDSASTLGAMQVPTQTQVQYGAFIASGSITGSYQSASQYWATASTAFTKVSSSGYLLSRSLDVALGTITGSLVADLNNTATTSNTVRRIQNVHTTQSVSQSIGSYI